MTRSAAPDASAGPPWHRRHLDVDGVRVHYLEAGEGDDVVVLIHGAIVWCCAELEFGEVLPRLARRGLRVIAPDVVGFGRTPGRGPQDYHSPDLAAFMVAFAKALGVRFHVGGNSHGGWLSTYLALELPDLVRSLIVINSGSTVIGRRDDDGPDRYDPRWAVPAQRPSIDDVRAELAVFYKQPHVVTEERVALTHEMSLAHYDFAVARQRATGGGSADRNRELAYGGAHISASADQLQLPVLLTWSRENRGARPDQAMPFFDRLRDAEMHTWVGAGHHVQLEHPQRWSDVVADFVLAHP